jgi:hypothetical protein
MPTQQRHLDVHSPNCVINKKSPRTLRFWGNVSVAGRRAGPTHPGGGGGDSEESG